MLFELSLIYLSFSLIFQTLYADKEGLVKLKNAVKDMRKAGNGEQELPSSMWECAVPIANGTGNYRLCLSATHIKRFWRYTS